MESTAVERAERPEATAAEQPEQTEQPQCEAAAEAGVEINLEADQEQNTAADTATEAAPSGSGPTSTGNSPEPARLTSEYDRNRALGIRVIAFVIALCVLVTGWALAKTAATHRASSSASGTGDKPGASSPHRRASCSNYPPR